MQILYILLAILMLGFIVTVHEFGHYLVGRLCGIGIVEFSIGMGPKLLGFKKNDIQYSLRLIPLGGYCAFVGEDENNSAPNAMNNQPVWKRFLTVLAGPAMNFVLAFLFCVILLSGFINADLQPWINKVYANTPAAEMGLQAGDVITEINGIAVSYDGEGVNTVHEVMLDADENSVYDLTLQRGKDEIISLSIQPEWSEAENRYMLGIEFGARTFTIPEAVSTSCSYMVDITKEMLQALKELVFKGQGVDDMMGPVGIISYVSDVVSHDTLYTIINLIFILSLNLGIMNLLPLPALDGGRLIFLIVEAIRRKPIPPEKEGMVHAIGLSLLLMLILFITYKDILRLFTGG